MHTQPTTPRHATSLGRRIALLLLLGITALAAFGMSRLPELGAGGLLYPARHAVLVQAPDGCIDDVVMSDDGLLLRGWRCTAAGPRRGSVVYLHGVADNRESASAAISRFTRRGFDVVAFDSRRHGASGGETCTYGYHERRDVRRIVATLAEGPVVLIGTSMGGAVALQAAAIEPRVTAVVAAEVFSDLETVARERAPFIFTERSIQAAFRIAAVRGHFVVADVSPVRAAAAISVPVLLLHGGSDLETPKEHSQRVYAALAGPKSIVIVPGATHNGALRADTWPVVEEWVEDVVARPR